VERIILLRGVGEGGAWNLQGKYGNPLPRDVKHSNNDNDNIRDKSKVCNILAAYRERIVDNACYGYHMISRGNDGR